MSDLVVHVHCVLLPTGKVRLSWRSNKRLALVARGGVQSAAQERDCILSARGAEL